MFLISGLRPVSIFQIDLAGKERLIELGYGIDITSFNVLFRLKIDSRYRYRIPREPA